MPQRRRQSLKERIENNIIVAIVAAGVVTGTTVAGVMEFLNAQHDRIITGRYDTEIEQLKNHITGITRSLAGQETLDVRKMFLNPVEIQSAQANGHVRYFPDDHFLVAADIDGLKYQHTTEAGVLGELFGKTNIPQALSDALGTAAADVWRGPPMPVNGGGIFSYLFPFVMVEDFTHAQVDKIASKMGLALSKDGSAASDHTTRGLAKNMDSNEVVAFLDHYVADNSATPYLMGALVSLYSSNLDFSVRRIEQVGPLMYMQIMYRFKDISVNHVYYPHFYVIREFFLLARNGDLFAISTFLPMENPAELHLTYPPTRARLAARESRHAVRPFRSTLS